jgi:hypothetical protein
MSEQDDNTCETLLFIGDLEGCQDKSHKNVPQSDLLCKQNTYDAIAGILSGDKNTHVAFLGDYFDQGPHMMESINGIAGLIEKHGQRVHVILGNRDLNKMRLKIEKDLNENFSVDKDNSSIFKDWRDKDGEGKLDLRNENGRIQKLLANTCGAGKALENLAEELGNKENEVNKALGLYTNIFTKDFVDDSSFVKNCQILFNHGKIIEIVNVGGKKVLLSHSGSFSPAVFSFDINNIKEPAEKQPAEQQPAEQQPAEQDLNNYELIEHYRKQLDIENISYDKMIDIDKVIEIYNNLYNKVRDEVIAYDNKEQKMSKNYYLLQAMGLKGTEEFASPIESCVITPGCKNDPIKPINESLNNYLKNQNIHFISHGHIPFCCTVPLIYKNSDIVFISNDTSNGNRPDVYTNLSEIPLSFVSSNEDKVGICSIGKKDSEHFINYELKNIKAFTNGNYDDNLKFDGVYSNLSKEYYDKFKKIYNNVDDIISYKEINKHFETPMFSPMPEAHNPEKGGKRRRTRRKNKNKNAKKTNKKGKSKKYRKKGRKTRKIRRRK